LALFLILVVTSGLVALFGPRDVTWRWILGLVGILFAAAVAIMLARRRRAGTVEHVFAEVQSQAADPRPHVIAHSYGTLVTAAALERFPSLQVGRVVLSACVLPRSFPWDRVIRQNPYALDSVRNEVGGGDWVVRIAAAVSRLVPHLGDAGLKGFIGESTLVHTADNCYGACSACTSESRTAVIHNVSFAAFEHCDPFVGELHTKRFWLPILWGIRPDEFQDLQQLCKLAVYLERKGDSSGLTIVEDEFLDRGWNWAQGSSIGDLLWEQLLRRYSYLGESAEVVLAGHFARSMRLFWHAIAEAHVELAKPKGDRRQVQLRRLNPWSAVGAATEVV
jgi:pimeloyl-ACP methyl ester carboxylesterase